MKTLRSWRVGLPIALLAATFAAPASAQDTANMQVTANVAPSCAFTGLTDMAFGTLNQSADNLATADITWVCTDGFSMDIRINGGGTGDVSNRAMTGPAALTYQIYTDGTYATVFGDGTTGSDVTVTGSGYGSPSTLTVFGRVLAADAAAALAGNYTDTVVVTISL